jgi:hypothetical protein
MSARKLDEQIRDHYLAQAPRPETLERLGQLIAGAHPAPRRRLPSVAGVAAAAAVLATLAGVVWLAIGLGTGSPADLSLEKASQAAAGHNERQELEARAEDFAELRARMKSLDFAPVEPEMVRESSMRLVGARYTTLAGALAAQIVYLDAHGTPCTLFQVRPVDRLATLSAGDYQLDGLEVSVWREKGLLMVLARPLA